MDISWANLYWLKKFFFEKTIALEKNVLDNLWLEYRLEKISNRIYTIWIFVSFINRYLAKSAIALKITVFIADPNTNTNKKKQFQRELG